MKRSIAWHKECLLNQRRHYLGLVEQIERLRLEHARGQKQINAYDAQIIKAELKGLTEFDADKFGKQREPQGERSDG